MFAGAFVDLDKAKAGEMPEVAVFVDVVLYVKKVNQQPLLCSAAPFVGFPVDRFSVRRFEKVLRPWL